MTAGAEDRFRWHPAARLFGADGVQVAPASDGAPVLDDGDSPMPTRKLSQLREVDLVARLSESGVANRQDGDIESKPVRVALPAKGPVELVIGD